ncbi:MAG: hypothetical protein IJ040_04215 [Lachnospiraceae bacterium]|nr:hypothetical protein [Lachnospiraceae bacterium]
MTEDRDIQAIIELLDNKTEAGVSRIHIDVEEKMSNEAVKEQYHHGRCDVGSPWATGSVRNF